MKIEIHNIKDKAKKDEVLATMNRYKTKIDAEKRKLLVGEAPKTSLTEQQQSEESLDRLQKARQQLAETEEVGNQITGNLAEQKETIQRARDNVTDSFSLGCCCCLLLLFALDADIPVFCLFPTVATRNE